MAYQRKKQPGVMIYFDLHPAIVRLSNEEGGRLFKAILEYAEYREEPEFDNGSPLSVLWPIIESSIDRDAQRYEETCRRRSKSYTSSQEDELQFD